MKSPKLPAQLLLSQRRSFEATKSLCRAQALVVGMGLLQPYSDVFSRSIPNPLPLPIPDLPIALHPLLQLHKLPCPRHPGIPEPAQEMLYVSHYPALWISSLAFAVPETLAAVARLAQMFTPQTAASRDISTSLAVCHELKATPSSAEQRE